MVTVISLLHHYSTVGRCDLFSTVLVQALQYVISIAAVWLVPPPANVHVHLAVVHFGVFLVLLQLLLGKYDLEFALIEQDVTRSEHTLDQVHLWCVVNVHRVDGASAFVVLDKTAVASEELHEIQLVLNLRALLDCLLCLLDQMLLHATFPHHGND